MPTLHVHVLYLSSSFVHRVIEIAKKHSCTEVQQNAFREFIDGFSKDLIDLFCSGTPADAKYCSEMVLPNATIGAESASAVITVMLRNLDLI